MKLRTKLLFLFVFAQLSTPSVAMEIDTASETSSTTSSPGGSPMVTSTTPTSPLTMSPRSLSPKSPKKAADLAEHDAALVKKVADTKFVTDAQEAIGKLHATYASWHTKQEHELEAQRDKIDELAVALDNKNKTISELEQTVITLTNVIEQIR